MKLDNKIPVLRLPKQLVQNVNIIHAKNIPNTQKDPSHFSLTEL